MKYKIPAFALILFALLTVAGEWLYRYHFFFIEQNQLFLFTGRYFSDIVVQPGGLARWIAELIVQFFAIPHVGAPVTALLLTGSGVLSASICRRMAPAAPLYLLWALPVVSLLCVSFNFNYFYQGTVAFLMMLAAFLFYVKLPRFGGRLVAGFVSVPLLFWFCGPVSLLYALCAVVWEAVGGFRRWYLSLSVALEAAAISWCALHFSVIGEWGEAFTPAFYFQRNLPPGVELWFAWASLPVAIVCTRLCRGLSATFAKRAILLTALQTVAAVLIFRGGIVSFTHLETNRMKTLDHHARTGNWDAIVEELKGPLSNYMYLNYLNLALAEKGVLADELFKYDQHGPNGLIIVWDKTLQSSIMLSNINFSIGTIAIAQQMAFEAYVSSPGYGNPAMLRRLVQTNLIYGAWPVAEKYLDILSGTLLYRRWAEEHRKFLYDDGAVEADPLLGGKRRCLPDRSHLANLPDRDLETVAIQNPSSETAIEYLGSMILLVKDLDSFRAFVEKHYGTEVLPTLPRSFQEAVILLYRDNPAMWERYGVAPAVMERFEGFGNRLQSNRAASGLVNIMRGAYGDTYWFYYMFTRQ